MRHARQTFVSNVRPIGNALWSAGALLPLLQRDDLAQAIRLESAFNPQKPQLRRRTPKTSLRILPRNLALFTQHSPNTRAKSFPCNPNKCSNLAPRARLYLRGRNYEHAWGPSRNSRRRRAPASSVFHMLRMPSHFPCEKRGPALPGTLRLLFRSSALPARAGDQHSHQAADETRPKPLKHWVAEICAQWTWKSNAQN